MALQAGASGLPFTPVPGLIGSDLMAVRDDFLTMPNPFDPEARVAVVPAIRPDVALVHAFRADPDGNLVVGRGGDDPLLIQASRFVIATAEEIMDGPITTLSADERLVAGIHVDVLAPAPHGSHPLGCGALYPADVAHLACYVEAARDPHAFAAYLRAYVLEPADESAYLERARREPAHA